MLIPIIFLILPAFLYAFAVPSLSYSSQTVPVFVLVRRPYQQPHPSHYESPARRSFEFLPQESQSYGSVRDIIISESHPSSEYSQDSDSSPTQVVRTSSSCDDQEGHEAAATSPEVDSSSPQEGHESEPEKLVTVYHPVLPGSGQLMIPQGYEIESVQHLPHGYSLERQEEFQASAVAPSSTDSGEERGGEGEERGEETGEERVETPDVTEGESTDETNEEASEDSRETTDDNNSPEAAPEATSVPNEFSAFEREVDRLKIPHDESHTGPTIPVIAISGLPPNQIIKNYEAIPSPAPEAVPKVTKEAIQVNPSLTSRQKNYLSKILDDYYQFIVKTRGASNPSSRSFSLERRSSRFSSFLKRKPFERSFMILPSSLMSRTFSDSLVPVAIQTRRLNKK